MRVLAILYNKMFYLYENDKIATELFGIYG